MGKLFDSIKREYNGHWDKVNLYSVVSEDFTKMMVAIKQAAYDGYNKHEFMLDVLPIYIKPLYGMTDEQKEMCVKRHNILVGMFEQEGFTVKEYKFDNGSYFKFVVEWA